MKEMFDARVHLGHKEGTLNPHMRQYVLGSRLKSLIIDLDQTTRLLGDALNFTAHVAARRGIILIINRSRQVSAIVNAIVTLSHSPLSFQTGHLAERLARETGEYAHTHDWEKATFMDSTTFFGATTRLPDLCIFLSCMDSVFDHHRAVTDANRLLIPSVGIVDTTSDPRLITYPVPGNDDTPCAIEFYCRLFKKAIIAGKQHAKTMPANT
jgi:small subunit ribosomal protein S2